MKSKNLFICSPNLGVLDTALPLIKYQKDVLNKNFSILFTKSNVSKSFNDDVFLAKYGKLFFDEFIFVSESGAWFKSSSFDEFQKINLYFMKYKYLIYKVENYSKKYIFFKLLNYIFKSVLLLAEKLIFSSNITNIKEVCKNIDVAIYDILEIKKTYFKELRKQLQDKKKLSVMHGISVLKSKETVNFIDEKYDNFLTILAFSKSEEKFFLDFGVEKSDIFVSGVFKHDKDWFEFIDSKREPCIFSDPVVLFSRSESDYFDISRKRLALENIKKVILEDNNYKIVIKTHFKSKNNDIYYEVFGRENYNDNWTFSNDHQFNLGMNAKFTLTFYSSICIDMLRMGIPNIEYLDLRGLKNFDNQYSLRDKNNYPVFDYRYNGLVIPSQDLASLKDAVSSVKKYTAEDIKKKYFSLFPEKSDLSFLSRVS